MFHRRKAIVSDSALRALRFRRRNPIEAAFHSVIRTLSSLLGLLFVLTISLMQAIDRGLEKFFSSLSERLFPGPRDSRPARSAARRLPRLQLPRLRLPVRAALSFHTSFTHRDALLPRDRLGHFSSRVTLRERLCRFFRQFADSRLFGLMAGLRLPSVPAHLPRTLSSAVAGVSCLLGVVAATAVTPGQLHDTTAVANTPAALALAVPSTAPASTREVTLTLAQPTLTSLMPPAANDLPFVVEERIRRGDTIQSLFRRMHIRDEAALDYLAKQPELTGSLRRLRAGRSISALVTQDGRIRSITLPPAGDADEASLLVERTGDGFRVSKQAAARLETMVEMRTGIIRHSLFGAADAAGLPDRVATKLAAIFGTEIDFSRDLRKGDRFSVIYEMQYRNGVAVRSGKVLAAEFVNQGRKHTLLLYREPDGHEAYYTPEGRSLNQAFLRYPLEFTRVSSSFGGRRHPIKGEWRHHNGTDFAAPTGTPVMASSDGVVKLAGQQRGYGNVIYLTHRGGYTTIYGHLSRFAKDLKQGQRVRQGQVIGYVGMTGWATGPHLHYEVRLNNVPHDPMKIALPIAQPMSKQELAAFRNQTRPMLDRLAVLGYNSNVAVNKIDARDITVARKITTSNTARN